VQPPIPEPHPSCDEVVQQRLELRDGAAKQVIRGGYEGIARIKLATGSPANPVQILQVVVDLGEWNGESGNLRRHEFQDAATVGSALKLGRQNG
jgi:hypothetical protein